MLGLNLIYVSKRGINNKCTWSHGHCHHDHRYLWIMQTNRSVWKCNVLFIITKTFEWFLRQINDILIIFLRPLAVHCRGNRMPIGLYKETVKQSHSYQTRGGGECLIFVTNISIWPHKNTFNPGRWTDLPLNKIASISQMIFQNVFSWLKKLYFDWNCTVFCS